mmetsp:Transcript_15405/g.52709  ORF Transcript_15405/g.52709 Transcript_15405/m.52709 type:complete len:216 (+) Transcript_15405:72-719(+)
MTSDSRRSSKRCATERGLTASAASASACVRAAASCREARVSGAAAAGGSKPPSCCAAQHATSVVHSASAVHHVWQLSASGSSPRGEAHVSGAAAAGGSEPTSISRCAAQHATSIVHSTSAVHHVWQLSASGSSPRGEAHVSGSGAAAARGRSEPRPPSSSAAQHATSVVHRAPAVHHVSRFSTSESPPSSSLTRSLFRLRFARSARCSAICAPTL